MVTETALKPLTAFSHLSFDVVGTLIDFEVDVLHVAQSRYHDIGGTRALGLTNAWIERRHGKAGYGGTIAPEKFTEPDYHFDALAGLADAADRAFEG